MIYVITGASGSGKTTCIPYIQKQLPEYKVVDFDDIGVPECADKIWRQVSTEKWLQHALLQERPMVICGQMVIGEIISCPSFHKIKKLEGYLLDCADIQRINRLRKRDTYGANQDTLNWSAWLRLHHTDPAWEKHVITENAWEELDFKGWSTIKSWEEAGLVLNTLNTSRIGKEKVANQLVQWIKQSAA